MQFGARLNVGDAQRWLTNDGLNVASMWARLYVLIDQWHLTWGRSNILKRDIALCCNGPPTLFLFRAPKTLGPALNVTMTTNGGLLKK